MNVRGIRRKPLRIVLLVVLLLGAACSSSTKTKAASGASSTSAAASGKTFRIALVTPSATNDLAFSQAMYSGINALKSTYKINLAVSANQFVVSDAANAISSYATQGYDLVIGNGSQYNASVLSIAKQFPNVSFLVYGGIGDTSGLPNLFAYQALANQGGYVEGVMAAMISKSHVVGAVGPIAVGDGLLYIDGFKAGALAQDPTAKLNVNYTGSFSDVSLAATTAKSLIAGGADVLTGTAQMVVGAIGVAKSSNVAWFGTQSSQESLAPNQVVATEVYHAEVALKQILAAIASGTKGGKAYDLSLSNKGEVITYNPGYNLPANVKAKGEQTIAGIENGSISVPQ
jgi:basic membrane lipoprotein Med (substrate-binding protein (PBP1-ABC) superfamily)